MPKPWKKLKPAEKTKQQEIELLLMEQSKIQKKVKEEEKYWQKLNPSEKTRQQEISLMLMEQQKLEKNKKTEKKKEKQEWSSLTPQQKTRLQEIELYIMETERNRRNNPLNNLQDVCEDIWQNMTGFEKTKQQIAELMLKEQEKFKPKKDGVISEITPHTWYKFLAVLKLEKEEMISAQRAMSAQEAMLNSLKEEYKIDRSSTPIELVRAISWVKHDNDNLNNIIQRKKMSIKAVDLGSEAEKALKSGGKLNLSAEQKAREQRDLEFSRMEGAISSAITQGYDVQIEGGVGSGYV